MLPFTLMMIVLMLFAG